MDLVHPMTSLQLAAALKKSGGNTPQMKDIKKFEDVLILLRHGERLDHVDRSWKSCDPPLSPAGRLQAFETAMYFLLLQSERRLEDRLKGFLSLIITSPFHRCVETALIINIVGFEGTLPLFINPLVIDWLQAKVFHTSPVLRGHYFYDESDMNLYYMPDCISLRDELASFLTSIGEDSKRMGGKDISRNDVQQWILHLDNWFSSHSRLLVWSSSSVYEQVYEDVSASLVVGEAINSEEPDKCSHLFRRGAELKKPLSHHASCGISYPESRKDLQKRCKEFVDSLFIRDDAIKPWDFYIPSGVMQSVKKEKKENLPGALIPAGDVKLSGKASQVRPERALLPPMHFLCVAHADVISGIVEYVCPKYRLNKGISVPYCSMTTLRRHNNFYLLVPSIVNSNKKYRNQNKHPPRILQQCRDGELIDEDSTLAATKWEVEEVGSLKAVTTKIVLRFL